MRYRLRTLLILMALLPPALAASWFAVERYRPRQRVGVWEDVSGPGAIDSFQISISCSIDDDENWVCMGDCADADTSEAEPELDPRLESP